VKGVSVKEHICLTATLCMCLRKGLVDGLQNYTSVKIMLSWVLGGNVGVLSVWHWVEINAVCMQVIWFFGCGGFGFL